MATQDCAGLVPSGSSTDVWVVSEKPTVFLEEPDLTSLPQVRYIEIQQHKKKKLQIIFLMYRSIFFFVPYMGSSLVQLILVIHSCSHKSEKCRLHLLQIAAGQKIIDNTCLIFQVSLFLYCILLISVSAKLFLSSFLLFLDRVILVLHEHTGLRKIYWHGFQMSKMLSFTSTQVQMPAWKSLPKA